MELRTGVAKGGLLTSDQKGVDSWYRATSPLLRSDFAQSTAGH
jgi:hypothetical protein